MPQHSFGASARAWAIISSSSERGIRIAADVSEVARGLVGSGLAAQREIVVVIVVVAADAAERSP